MKEADHYKKILETWDKVASMYQEKFMDLDLYNDTYDIFCELIKKGIPKVLEIGCGPGNITRYILTQRPDLIIEGIDISPNMIELAKVNIPGASFKVMDCRKIDALTPGYDAIICGFCMPYLTKEDCLELLKNCSSLLNSDGILYFSTIEDDYSRSKYETSSDGQHTMFVYYHQEDYLLDSLTANDLELVSLVRKTYTRAGGESSVNMVFIAKKK